MRRFELRRARSVHPGVVARFGRIPHFLVVDVVAPRFIRVGLRFGIPTGEETRRFVELVVGAQDAGGVRVIENVLVLPEILREDVVDETAVEGEVGTRTDARVDVRIGGGTRVARVDHDPRGAAVLSALDPTRGKRMVFHVVRADRHDDVGVLEVAPVRSHRAAAERGGETRDGRGVAHARLVVDGDDAERAGELLNEPAFFVVELGGAERGDAVATVHRNVAFLFNEGFVAGLLHALGDGVDGFFPGNLFPGLRARTAHHRMEHAVGVELRLAILRHDVAKTPHGRALRAETAEVDRMIRIAFEIDEFAVAGRADRAATAGAVATDVRRFGDVLKLVRRLGRGGRGGSGRSGDAGGGRRRAEKKATLQATSA